MSQFNPVATTFILPTGMRLGGVTTWSIQMANCLNSAETPTFLLAHRPYTPYQLAPLATSRPIHNLPGAHPGFARTQQIAHYLPTYAAITPGIVIPNYTVGTYATLAALSQKGQQLRTIGFAHTDQPYYYRLLQFYAPLIHKFVAVSAEIGAKLRQQLPTRSADVIVRPYAVLPENSSAHQYTAADMPLQLVYAGRINQAQKRIDDLLQLASRLLARGIDFRLRIIGSDPEGKIDLQQLLSTYPPILQQKITLRGEVAHAQMGAVWDSADICLLTSAYEGISIAMLEASAHGCVPVVTAVSGVKQTITHGQNGFYAPVGDLAGLADAIQLLASDRTLLARCGQAAAAHIATQHDMPAYVTWLQTLIQQVMQEPLRVWPDQQPILPSPTNLITFPRRVIRFGKRFLRSAIPHAKLT